VGDKAIKTGYALNKKKSETVHLFPPSETQVMPYNKVELDLKAENIKLVNGVQGVIPLRLAIFHTNSRKRRKQSTKTILGSLYTLDRFISFLETVDKPEMYANDKAIFEGDYKNWLINEGYSERTIGGDINTLNYMVSEGYKLEGTDHLKNDAVVHIMREGKFYNADCDSYPSLDQIYPDAKINSNDLDLLIGLRETMVWYLNEIQQLRKNVLDELTPDLKAYLEELKENKESPLSFDKHFAMLKSKFVEEKFDKLAMSLADVILNQNSEIANELMFCEMYSMKGWIKDYLEDKKPYTSSEITAYFDYMKHDYSKKKRGKRLERFKKAYRGLEARLFNKHRIHSFFPSLSFLVYPTVDESLAMEWLLASERVQFTGIKMLNFTDNLLLDEEEKTFQLQNIIKWRSVGPQVTPRYKKDNIYKVHLNWVNLLKDAVNYVEGITDKYIPPFVRASEERRKQRDFHYSRKGFWLMCLDNTYMNRELLNDVKGTKNEAHVKSFLKLLQFHLYRVKNATEIKAKKDYKNKSNKKIEHDTGKGRGIGLKVIAQTRALLDENVMSGRLIGHSQNTHKKDYLNRTKSKFVNAQSATFAADVGNAMKNEARRFLNMSEFVSVEQIKDILNINGVDNEELSDLQKIIEIAETQGFIADLTTELKKGGKTYILQTPWTAALIKGQIEHINKEIKSIEFSNPHKRNEIQLRQMYLRLVLNRFPKKILQEAEVILEEYDNIPYPSMV
jgi:hypothetical protein